MLRLFYTFLNIVSCDHSIFHVEFPADDSNFSDFSDETLIRVQSTLRGARTGKIITYEKNPDYFGYSQPLEYNDALNFCGGFRGSVIVPQNDDEMRLVQFLAFDIFAAYKNGLSQGEKNPFLDYRVLWLGIRFELDRWISEKTGEEVQSEYWENSARANTINIAKFKIKNETERDVLIRNDNKLEFYSSSGWENAPEENLFVICVNKTIMKSFEKDTKMFIRQDDFLFVKNITNHDARNICKERYSLSNFQITRRYELVVFIKIVEIKERGRLFGSIKKMSQSYPKKLGYGLQEPETPEIPVTRNFAENQTEIKFLVNVIPRTLRDQVISGRNDVDFYLDTKVGLASLVWKNYKIGKLSVEEQKIGKWEISGYDPKNAKNFVLCKVNKEFDGNSASKDKDSKKPDSGVRKTAAFELLLYLAFFACLK